MAERAVHFLGLMDRRCDDCCALHFKAEEVKVTKDGTSEFKNGSKCYLYGDVALELPKTPDRMVPESS
jgi:hypothetical protein